MIKAVIFDFGGVLLRTHDQSLREKWEQRLGLAPRQLEALVLNGTLGHQAQRGELSEEQFWQDIGKELGVADDLDAFRADFWGGDVLDEALVDYIRRLRPAYQTALISNAFDGLREDLGELHGITDAFDLIVISAEEQVMKPDAKIYLETLSRLGCRAEEAVFVDDSAANIAGARAAGVHAVHYRAGMDVAAALAALGVEPKERV